jgi:hypothetical protein
MVKIFSPSEFKNEFVLRIESIARGHTAKYFGQADQAVGDVG